MQILMAGGLICSPAAFARSNGDTQFNNPHIAADRDTDTTIMTTGVLEKGIKPHEYTIKTDDGQTFNLTSEYVNMHKCLGQKVVVTGSVMKHQTRVDERQQGQAVTHLDVTEIHSAAS